jgi:hypothetical protein
MNIEMQYGHRQATLIWSCSMDLVVGHAWMPECRNADKKLSPALLDFPLIYNP